MKVVRTPSIEVQVHAMVPLGAEDILSDDALKFIGWLCHKFEVRRQALLSHRAKLALRYDAMETPHFSNSPEVKDMNWRCAPIPVDLLDRRVEITGPVDRKMVINGLNSGANVYMADFEDSTSPTWKNIIEGQVNLRDAVNGTISYTNPETKKVYLPNKKTSILFVRPRGLHLDEGHITVNGKVASGSLIDFGLYLFHNVHALIAKGSGPYYYIPKLEGRLEARLWNDIFLAAQDYLGIPRGTIRATVLLETITASFEMEEMLYELKDHSLGLNCGRWDYAFSYIKKFKMHPDKIARVFINQPDRSHITMTSPLMKSYVDRLIYICHKRKTFAMGGMSAAIPIKDDAKANNEVMERIRQDKIREALAGHDGTWVAHPALVDVAKEVFDKHMPTPNQIESKPGLAGRYVSEKNLLQLPNVPFGEAITSDGLSKGISIVLCYTEAWLRGVGCIPLNNHMEDAATAEISRAQIWQWRHQKVSTQDDGKTISPERISLLVENEVEKHDITQGKWLLAGKLVRDMLNRDILDDFLTTVAYPHIMTLENVDTLSRL